MPASAEDRLLVQRIRVGDPTAWQQCIDRFEGRLLAFVNSRLRDSSQAEDLVQDTFLGFLTALPNFDEETPIDAFLFAIAAHKITDVLRKQGRRPRLPISSAVSEDSALEPPGPHRVASSIARSREERGTEESVLADCLRSLIEQWLSRGELVRLKCAELLLVKGLPNQEVARTLAISEQDVANHKAFVVGKLKEAARRAAVHESQWKALGISD